MKKTIRNSVISGLTLLLLASRTFAGECADAYLTKAARMQESMAFGAMIKDAYDYERMLKIFDQDRATAITTMGAFGVAFPILAVIAGISSGVASFEIRYLRQVGEVLAGSDTPEYRKGLKRLHRLVEDEILVDEEEFEEFLAMLGNRVSLCDFTSRIDLSEKGRERVGDAGFFAFAHRTVGTPEWREFMNDTDNFQMVWGPAPLEKDKLKQRLIRELVEAGFPRRP